MRRTVVLGSSACADQPSGSPSPISHPATPTPKPATAFNTSQLGQHGPVPLRGILQLSGQSTKLQSEENLVLTALAKTADEVTCTGDQFSGHGTNLAGRTWASYA